MKEVLIDSVLDCLKLLPFLYLSYLLVEYAEHRMSSKTKTAIYRAGKAGPLIGSIIGIIPQCGFSAAAASLFAGRMISPGTLLAVFLSTSDEMLPIMASEGVNAHSIAVILLVKMCVGTVSGFAVDFAVEKLLGRGYLIPDASKGKGTPGEEPIKRFGHPVQENCGCHDYEDENCGCSHHGHSHCGHRGIWISALWHTAQTALFLFLISLAIGLGMDWFQTLDPENLTGIPGVTEAVAGLIGMVPNCAASVFITQLFLEGVLGSGAMFAGLLCAAGTGLLVLYRENKSIRQNLALTGVLYVSGTLAGILLGLLQIV